MNHDLFVRLCPFLRLVPSLSPTPVHNLEDWICGRTDGLCNIAVDCFGHGGASMHRGRRLGIDPGAKMNW